MIEGSVLGRPVHPQHEDELAGGSRQHSRSSVSTPVGYMLTSITSPTGMGSIAVPREGVCLQDGLKLDQPSPADARLDRGGGSIKAIDHQMTRTPLIRRFFYS